jgi:hypothetical protein
LHAICLEDRPPVPSELIWNILLSPGAREQSSSNDLVYIDKLAVERIEECCRFGRDSILAQRFKNLMMTSRFGEIPTSGTYHAARPAPRYPKIQHGLGIADSGSNTD